MESTNTRRLTLIGLTGKAGSGKDHMGSMLWRTHGFIPIGIADTMKEMLSAQEGIPMDVMLEGDKPPEVRTRLQEFGEVGKRTDEDFWVKRVEARLWTLAHRLNHDRFVVTDVRFQNEADLIHKYDGWVIWLRGRTRPLTKTQERHPSELAQVRADMVVTNSVDRNMLAEEEIRRFIAGWLKRR